MGKRKSRTGPSRSTGPAKPQNTIAMLRRVLRDVELVARFAVALVALVSLSGAGPAFQVRGPSLSSCVDGLPHWLSEADARTFRRFEDAKKDAGRAAGHLEDLLRSVDQNGEYHGDVKACVRFVVYGFYLERLKVLLPDAPGGSPSAAPPSGDQRVPSESPGLLFELPDLEDASYHASNGDILGISVATSSEAVDSARSSVAYLAGVMDEFHDRFPVYDDVSSPGNHFHTYGRIPSQFSPVTMNGSSTEFVHSGATAIRCEFDAITPTSFGGFYLQNGILGPNDTTPSLNFGTVPDAGIDLTGATALTFWARAEGPGNARVEFFVGGVGRDAVTGSPTAPFPDSTPRHPSIGTVFVLTPTWQKFTIDLSGRDLSYVLGGFAWVANAPNNPGGAVFYLDDIQYELDAATVDARLDSPRFLRSFTTLAVQPDPNDENVDDDLDLVLRNLAFVYDNALALLAFLADGSADSLRRARLLGDAFVYAAGNDRLFSDGRVRDAYAAGDISLPPGWIPNGKIGTVPIPGFFDEANQAFVEVEQSGVSTGNNAWVMVALLALHQETQDPTYLDAARRIGEFIVTFKQQAGTFQGFVGGLADPEITPTLRSWASTEHNLDIIAAFDRMFEITGESQWATDAAHARTFVDAMWDPVSGCFLTGTGDPETQNTTEGQLPLDTQSWSALALRDVSTAYPDVLLCAESNHATSHHGFSGFDFNEDLDGVWFEGTAQMAIAYAVTGQAAAAEVYRSELRAAQSQVPFGDTLGVAAACHDGVSSGFGFKLFQRLHIAATSWSVFAQLGYNPYYQDVVDPPDASCAPAPMSGCRAAERSGLVVKNPSEEKKRLVWTWKKGEETLLADFGDAETTSYALCLYDEAGLVLGPAETAEDDGCGAKPCWRKGNGKRRYRSPTRAPHGLRKLRLKAGVEGKAAVDVRADGPLLDLPSLPLSPTVTSQLVNSAGECWESTFAPSDIFINSDTHFRAKARGFLSGSALNVTPGASEGSVDEESLLLTEVPSIWPMTPVGPPSIRAVTSGRNVISGRAERSRPAEQRESAPLDDERRVRSLVVSSGHTETALFDALEHAKRDARKVAAAMSHAGVPVSVLQNTQFTREMILDELADEVARSRPGDTFIFYFAGHGVSAGGDTRYLVTDHKNGSGYLSLDEVGRILSHHRGRTFIVTDACFESVGEFLVGTSGQSDGFPRGYGQGNPVLIAAATPGQLAVESSVFAGGTFTRALLEEFGRTADSREAARNETAAIVRSALGEEAFSRIQERTEALSMRVSRIRQTPERLEWDGRTFGAPRRPREIGRARSFPDSAAQS